MLLNFLVYFLVALTKDGCSVRKASVLKMLSLNLNVFCLRWYVSTFARLSVGQVFQLEVESQKKTGGSKGTYQESLTKKYNILHAFSGRQCKLNLGEQKK